MRNFDIISYLASRYFSISLKSNAISPWASKWNCINISIEVYSHFNAYQSCSRPNENFKCVYACVFPPVFVYQDFAYFCGAPKEKFDNWYSDLLPFNWKYMKRNQLQLYRSFTVISSYFMLVKRFKAVRILNFFHWTFQKRLDIYFILK